MNANYLSRILSHLIQISWCNRNNKVCIYIRKKKKSSILFQTELLITSLIPKCLRFIKNDCETLIRK